MFKSRTYFPFLNWLPLAKRSLKDDIIAGITGTIIVIPQAVAFAMIAGLPPIYGFYTAMVTPIVAALFGSSYHLISGPTTAISIVVYSTLIKFVNPESDLETFISLALVLTFLAGFFQWVMGLLRMGKLVNFVSHSVIIGFTAGAGILIAFKQLKHVFGLNVPQGSTILEIVQYIFQNIADTNWMVFAVAIGTLLIAILIRLLKPLKRYYMLIAMILGSVLALILGGTSSGIETVGQLPSHLPPFEIPDLSYENVKLLSSGAMVLALLGLIEAVAIGRAIALHTHQRIDGNQEFIGQGLSNMIASFFSSYAGSGSFTRSGVNHQAGAKTPMSGIFASVFLMVVLLIFADYASFLPKAAMGGIIVLVGYNLIDFHHIKQVYKASGRELIVLGITFFGTLFFDLEFALLAGILTSFFFYMERTSKPNIAVLALNKNKRLINSIRDKEASECSNLKIVRIDGSLYFGSIEKIANYFSNLYEENEIQYVLIAGDGINFIDLAAAEWLTNEIKKWQKNRGGIFFAGLKLVSQDVIQKGGFVDKMGSEIFFKEKRAAIEHIHKLIQTPCKAQVFDECHVNI
ncbi:MAG: SulP family inorganic anion transporter [Flavobacteriaceae bacterium]|nr:SulP family inorganic anion transporter [Bacteroidia bacterium]MBT8288238.1 SulP family inorganic anion transporter [Bacteroidia bacterium]NNF74673.1 SulP family inorganic anion transporter [Flavobacteriaceae bacterium]NNK71567.1 SulP family inorganic anion transporter [Flavobacteriaceae bacterium]